MPEKSQDSEKKKGHVRAQLDAAAARPQSRMDAISMPDGRMRNPATDPLMRQKPAEIEEWLLDPEKLTLLYEGIWFCRHVAEILSEDPTRNWFDIEFLTESGDVIDDDVRARDFQQYCEELNAQDVIQTALLHEAVYGDGLVLCGIRSKGGGTASPTAIITPDQVGEVLYLVSKPRDGQFKDIILDDDLNSETYGLPKQFQISQKLAGSQSSGASDLLTVDASRALHFQTRPRVKSKFGLPVFVPLWSVIQLISNLEWSAGQIAYNMATRVVKSDEMVGDIEQRVEFAESFENQINTLSSVILGQNETLSTVSNSPGDLSWLAQLTWDIAAAATRLNKTRLLGTQSGALASADTDMKRYYEWIQSRQELWLRKPLRHLSAIILSTDSMSTAQSAGGKLVVSFRPRTSDRVKAKAKTSDLFRLVFRPVESPTEKEAANLKVRAADAISRRLEAFRNLSMGLQNLADLGISEPGEILKVLLGDEVSDNAMSDLMASTSGLEPSVGGPESEASPENPVPLDADGKLLAKTPTSVGKKPTPGRKPEAEEEEK